MDVVCYCFTESISGTRYLDPFLVCLIAIVWSWLALVRHFPIQFVPHVTSLSSHSKEMDRWIPDKYNEPISNTWRRRVHVIEVEFYRERTRFIFELNAIRHSCHCYLTSAATLDHHLRCYGWTMMCSTPRVVFLAIISDIHLINGVIPTATIWWPTTMGACAGTRRKEEMHTPSASQLGNIELREKTSLIRIVRSNREEVVKGNHKGPDTSCPIVGQPSIYRCQSRATYFQIVNWNSLLVTRLEDSR